MAKPPKTTFYLLRDSFFCSVLTLIVGLFLHFLLSNLNFLGVVDNAFSDFDFTDLYYSKLKRDRPVNGIVLVNIGRADRRNIAHGIRAVSENKPSAIGLDVIFKEKCDPNTTECKSQKNKHTSDSILKQVLHSTKSLVTAYQFNNDLIDGNHAYFQSQQIASGYAYLNNRDPTDVVRTFIGAKVDKDTLFSFASMLAIISGKLSKKEVLDELSEELIINYKSRDSSFLTFELEEVIEQKKIPAIEGAIVLFGHMGTSISENKYDIEDKHFTPMNRKFVGRSFPDMYGVVIQANILKCIIDRDYSYKIRGFVWYFIVIMVCWMLIALGMIINKKSPLVYDLSIKVLQVLSTVILLTIAYLMASVQVHIQITPIVFIAVLGLEMICFYQPLVNRIKKYVSWKGYMQA